MYLHLQFHLLIYLLHYSRGHGFKTIRENMNDIYIDKPELVLFVQDLDFKTLLIILPLPHPNTAKFLYGSVYIYIYIYEVDSRNEGSFMYVHIIIRLDLLHLQMVHQLVFPTN